MGNFNYLENERLEQERIEFNNWKHTVCCEGNPKTGDSVWDVIMDGPKDSPYMGGKFKIRITFTKEYPDSSPKFEFLTPICHINISGNHICLNSLESNYDKNSSIINLLGGIFMMLTSPNIGSAYSAYKDLYLNHYENYLSKAREMTKDYAK